MYSDSNICFLHLVSIINTAQHICNSHWLGLPAVSFVLCGLPPTTATSDIFKSENQILSLLSSETSDPFSIPSEEKPKSPGWPRKPKIMWPLLPPVWLHPFFLAFHCNHTGLLAIPQTCQACSHLRAFALVLSAGMLFPPLTHISANMATFSYQENLLHYGSEKQQASPPSMVTGLCPAIFFSVASSLLCCLCPPSRGVLEPAQSTRGRHRHCFPTLCSMMSDCGLKPSRLRIFTQRKLGNTTI